MLQTYLTPRLYKYNKDIAKRSKCLLITYIVLSTYTYTIRRKRLHDETTHTEIVWKIRHLYEGLSATECRNSLHNETLTHTVLAW